MSLALFGAEAWEMEKRIGELERGSRRKDEEMEWMRRRIFGLERESERGEV
jgi:hypothetical protein